MKLVLLTVILLTAVCTNCRDEPKPPDRQNLKEAEQPLPDQPLIDKPLIADLITTDIFLGKEYILNSTHTKEIQPKDFTERKQSHIDIQIGRGINTGICPSPFRLRGNECLFIPEYLSETLNWDESRQKCLSMGGDLAQPQDMVDFVNFLEESYPGFKPSTVWLGATDREVEQEWKWLSGESVPPAMWEPWIGNQPSGDGNCMEIHKWPYTEFFMNDWYCHNKGYFACEIDETTPPPVTCPDITPCPTTQGCPEGLLSLLGTHKCVKVFDDVDRNWYEAHLKCRKEGLTMVKTSNENALNIRQALVNLLGDAGSYAWLDAEFNGVQYVWGDGEVIANDNSLWYTPYINLKPGYCMGLLNSQTFIDRSPSTVYYGTLCNAIAHGRKAFCEYDNCPANCYHGSCNNGVCYCQPGYTGPKCSGKDTGDGCPLDAGFFWLSSSSQCFKLMLDHGNLNWEEGKAVCESNNLKLAHPYDVIGLRSYLAQRYGNYAAFLNARDNGAGAITWLDSGEIIKNDHPLWRTGAPYSLSNACLIIQGLDAEINKPFWATQCQWKHSTRYPLCELE